MASLKRWHCQPVGQQLYCMGASSQGRPRSALTALHWVPPHWSHAFSVTLRLGPPGQMCCARHAVPFRLSATIRLPSAMYMQKGLLPMSGLLAFHMTLLKPSDMRSSPNCVSTSRTGSLTVVTCMTTDHSTDCASLSTKDSCAKGLASQRSS
jgi:hypothetical protein